MALKPFNVSNGVTIGTSTSTVIDANSSVTANAISANGNVNFTTSANVALGAVANLHITGGSNLQFLQTDGSGNLTWATVSSNSLTNGNSNVVVAANGNVTISSAGNANILTITGTGANIAGTANVTGNIAIGGTLDVNGNSTLTNISSNGEIALTGANVSLGAVANLHITGGSNLQFLQTDGSGNLTWATVSSSQLANGNSNIVVTANSVVLISSNGQSNIINVYSNGTHATTTIADDLLISGNITVEGNTNYINVETYVVEDPVIELGAGPNGTTPVQNTNDLGLLLRANTASEGAVNRFMGWDTSNAEFAFSSNATDSSNVIAFAALGNVRANYFLGNITGPLVNGNSNISIIANSNINISAVGNANILTITGVGANVTGTLDVTGNLTVSQLTANSNVNLGAVANVHITGGSSNQFLQTDGSGNLTWTTVSSSGLVNGNSNIVVGPNSNVTVSVAGNANIITVTGTGANISGTANITGNLYSANITTGTVVANGNVNLTSSGNVSLGAVANVHITGGSNLQFLQTDGSGNLSWATVSSNSLTNGNSNVVVEANGNVTISSTGNANILTVTGTGANITGTANVSGNLSAGNANITSSLTTNTFTATGLMNIQGGVGEEWQAPTIGSTVTLNVANGMIAYISSISQAFTLDVVGTSALGNANSITVAVIGAPTASNYYPSNVTLNGGSALTVNWAGATPNNLTTGSTYAFQFSILKSGTSTASLVLGSWTLFNSSVLNTVYGITNGNSNLSILIPDGSLSWNSNGTSNIFVANSAGLTVNGNLSANGTTSLTGNLSTTGANVSLGAVANLHITGGSSNQYLKTDGSGNLTWADAGNATAIVNGNSNVIVSANANVNISANGLANILSVYSNGTHGTTTVTDDLLITGNITVQGNTNYINVETYVVEDPIIELGAGANGTTPAQNTNDLGTLLRANTVAEGAVNRFMGWDTSNAEFAFSSNASDTSNVITITSLGNVRASYFLGNVIGNITGSLANGNSNISIAGNSNVTIAVAGNTNILTVTGTGIVLGANATNVQLGAVGNLHITGGSSGQYLQTDGSGNLSFAGVTQIANGSSNIVVAQNGAITVGASGNSGVVTITGGGLAVSGTGNVTGNLLAGNLNTSGITANGNVELTGANVSLGAVANLHITGGSNLQFLQTDGNGNLSWSTVSSSSLENGNSNIVVAANANVTISANGVANVVTVTTDGIVVSGNVSISDSVIFSDSGNSNVGAATTTTTSTSATNLVKITASAGAAIEFVLKGVDNDGDARYMATVNAMLVDSGNVDYTIFGSLDTPDSVGNFAVVLTDSNANISLQVTSATTNSTTWTTQYRVF